MVWWCVWSVCVCVCVCVCVYVHVCVCTWVVSIEGSLETVEQGWDGK